MADTVPKGSKRAWPYAPGPERLFLGPYPADQGPQEVLVAAQRVVERFQKRPARRSPLA